MILTIKTTLRIALSGRDIIMKTSTYLTLEGQKESTITVVGLGIGLRKFPYAVLFN